MSVWKFCFSNLVSPAVEYQRSMSVPITVHVDTDRIDLSSSLNLRKTIHCLREKDISESSSSPTMSGWVRAPANIFSIPSSLVGLQCTQVHISEVCVYVCDSIPEGQQGDISPSVSGEQLGLFLLRKDSARRSTLHRVLTDYIGQVLHNISESLPQVHVSTCSLC